MNCVVYMGLRPFQCAQFLGGLKLLKAGKFSIEDDTRPGRPKTSVTKANIAAVKIVVKQDARLSVKDKASCTGISEGSVQTILKKSLDLRKVCARWVPDLLTEEQKTQRLKCARELLKTYKGCNSWVISNLLTVMNPGCTCLSHKEGLIISNRSEKIKNAHILPREPYVQKRCCTQFSLIQMGQSFKCLVHLVIQSLANSTRILY